MKKALFLPILFLFSSYLLSQNENPFAKFGYDVLVASSSKGEFKEFHDQEEIVEIGSVLFNTRTNQIVKILDKDSTTIDISAATAAMSIDPHCERYYWISPYTYCLNNPIKFVDPDGRDIVLSIKYKGEKQPRRYTYNPQIGLTDAKGNSVSLPVNSKAYAVVSAYNEVYKTDNTFKEQIDALVKSENDHIIVVGGSRDKGKNAVEAGTPSTNANEDKETVKKGKSIGTTTSYNLSKKEKARLKDQTGIEHTDGSIISHEVRHQYDYETGNMSDSVGKSGKDDPSEQRAVENEDRYRRKNNMEERKTY